MVSISRIISTLSKLEGSKARVTLSGKQFLQIAEKNKALPEVSEAISGLVAKHPKLKADIAYKVSEQGSTVGAITLRNGKEVVGRGAASATGLGTEEAIIKMRLSAGQNGEIALISGWTNFAHTPRIQDYELATSLKDGVVKTCAKAGEYGASRSRINIPAVVDAAGLTEEAALAMEKGNNFLDKLHIQVRNLLTGKKVDMKDFLPFGKKAKAVHVENSEKTIEELGNKVLSKDNFVKMTQNTEEIEKFRYELKDLTAKIPRKEEPIDLERFKKDVLDRYENETKNIIVQILQTGKDDTKALQYLQELKNQFMKAEELGIKTPKGWKEWTLDNFKNLT